MKRSSTGRMAAVEEELPSASRSEELRLELLQQLTTALRLRRLYALENRVVAEAIGTLTRAIQACLEATGKVVVLVDRRLFYVDGRAMSAGAWAEDLLDSLDRSGVAGLFFGGQWERPHVEALLRAFGPTGATSAYPEVAAAAEALAAPALLRVFNAAQAEAYGREEEEAHLPPRRLAVYYYARLVALVEASLRLTAAGRRDDPLTQPLRQTFGKLLVHLGAPPFEHQLLMMTAAPVRADPLAHHAANVAVLSLLAGRLLGLSDGPLCDLGYAALLHDVGRAGQGIEDDDPDHVTRGLLTCLQARSNQANLLRTVVVREHHWLPPPPAKGAAAQRARLPHPASRLVQVVDAYDRLRSGQGGRPLKGPELALRELEQDPRYDAAAVALLRDVVGRHPPGTVVRLDTGERALVIHSGARRPGRLVVRGLEGGALRGPLRDVLAEQVTGGASSDTYRSGRWRVDLLAPLPDELLLAEGSGSSLAELTALAPHALAADSTPDEAGPAAAEAPAPIAVEDGLGLGRLLVEAAEPRAYLVGRLLGRGGQGEVYEASVDGGEARGRRVVVKVARPGAERNLALEQLVYAQEHEGLVQMLDSGRLPDGRSYLVLERLEPMPAERFGTGRTDPGVAVEVFLHLLEPMRRLHFKRQHALVLCDIKPANIMLRLRDGARRPLSNDDYLAHLRAGAYRPAFVDAGVALARDDLERSGGQLQRVVGTPVYLPPESTPVVVGDQVLHGRYSHHTDVYALTLAFYVMLTGSRPYDRYGIYELAGNEFLLTLFSLKREGADPLRRGELTELFGAEVAGSLLELLDAGLAPDPERRASAQTLARLCSQAFAVEPRTEDDGGLTLRQTRLPVAPPGFYRA